jgi:hypothetical protein
MFGNRPRGASPAGLASYDRLRRHVMAIAEADGSAPGRGRDRGVVGRRAWRDVAPHQRILVPDTPAIALVRDAMIDQLTTPKAAMPRRMKGIRQ